MVFNNPLYSNNDVNFLNFLNELEINFKNIGNKIKINFQLVENFKMNELFIIYTELLNEFINDNKSKEIKLKDKLFVFSDHVFM